MSYLNKVERNREVDRQREESRKRKAAKHQAKLDAKKPRRAYVTSGKPNLPADVVDLWKQKSTIEERRPGVIRRMLKTMGSIFTGKWIEREKQKELLAQKKAEEQKAHKA